MSDQPKTQAQLWEGQAENFTTLEEAQNAVVCLKEIAASARDAETKLRRANTQYVSEIEALMRDRAVARQLVTDWRARFKNEVANIQCLHEDAAANRAEIARLQRELTELKERRHG